MGALLDVGNEGLGGHILAVLQALVALLLVAALVWYARRWLLGGRFGARRSERIQVEERFPLDLRNALLIVRVEQRRLLLATCDNAPARLIAELSAGDDAPARAARASE